MWMTSKKTAYTHFHSILLLLLLNLFTRSNTSSLRRVMASLESIERVGYLRISHHASKHEQPSVVLAA